MRQKECISGHVQIVINEKSFLDGFDDIYLVQHRKPLNTSNSYFNPEPPPPPPSEKNNLVSLSLSLSLQSTPDVFILYINVEFMYHAQNLFFPNFSLMKV